MARRLIPRAPVQAEPVHAPSSAPTAGTRARRERLRRVWALAGALVYLLGISAYLLTHGGWPTPDYLIPPLLLFAIARGEGWPFVLDWGPFLLLVLSWQATAGIADQLGRPIHVSGPVRAERWLFHGQIPTVVLQERMFDPTRAHWYDWAATIQHTLHFVLPVAMGLVIWLRNRRTYWRYLASVMTLFYLGFIGYALYPAAPPWMAGLQDAIPPVHRVAIETVLRLPASAPIGLAYTHMSANQVAAIPSLHAALPLLLALIVLRLWGAWALPVLLYPLTMGFNLVYLGEHYVVDVLAGYAVAVAAYALVWVLPELMLTRVPAPRLPRFRVPPAVRRAADGALPVLAVLSVALIGFTLRPGRPTNEAGPVVPGLQVQAGQTTIFSPQPCDQGTATSLTAGALLLPVTGRYAVFLLDLDANTCYALSANASFAAPRAERIPVLAARAPVRLAPLRRMPQGIEYYALRTGTPTPAIVEAELPADHYYLLVVALAEVADFDAALTAVDALEALVLIPAAATGEPAPVPSETEPPPPPAAAPLPTPTPTVTIPERPESGTLSPTLLPDAAGEPGQPAATP